MTDEQLAEYSQGYVDGVKEERERTKLTDKEQDKLEQILGVELNGEPAILTLLAIIQRLTSEVPK